MIVGAENIHRAGAFKPLDTANIIFGDDALATALEIGGNADHPVPVDDGDEISLEAGQDFIAEIAAGLLPWALQDRLDGIIVDNQLGLIEYRVPATAARIQHALIERTLSQGGREGHFPQFPKCA